MQCAVFLTPENDMRISVVVSSASSQTTLHVCHLHEVQRAVAWSASESVLIKSGSVQLLSNLASRIVRGIVWVLAKPSCKPLLRAHYLYLRY